MELRESDSANSKGDFSEGSNQNLGRKSLHEYTTYKGTRQVNENEYDQYDPEYEGTEKPDRERDQKSCTSKKLFCKGRLSNL